MPSNTLGIALAVTLAAATGCASTQSPVLYPNATRTRVVRRGAEGAAVGAAAGAAGAAVYGGDIGRAAGTGAAAGAAAGAVRGGFDAADPNPTYRRFVERCLRERGYDVIGWQ